MPDIVKCHAIHCKIRHTCYRYISQPYHFGQMYFDKPPMKEDGSCEYYWEHKPKLNDRRTETKTED